MALPTDPEETQEHGTPVPDYSPEARRRAAKLALHDPMLPGFKPPTGRAYYLEVAKRTFSGTYNDGFVHAGNLAYSTLFAIFPFFIFGAAVFSAFGEEGARAVAIDSVLSALPPSVGDVLGPDARNVINARSGILLWVGAAFALWSVSNLVETLRDILRRAYGTKSTRSFWYYRLLSTGIIIAAVLLLMLGLIAQVTIGAIEEVIDAWLPDLTHALGSLALSRIVPTVAIYCSIFMLFLSLTPHRYRGKAYPKWPGALLVTVWWVGVTLVFPPLLRTVFNYSLTYGSLAGIMITLFFFWLIGLGVVAGAELNAALASTPEEETAMVTAEVEQENTTQ